MSTLASANHCRNPNDEGIAKQEKSTGFQGVFMQKRKESRKHWSMGYLDAVKKEYATECKKKAQSKGYHYHKA